MPGCPKLPKKKKPVGKRGGGAHKVLYSGAKTGRIAKALKKNLIREGMGSKMGEAGVHQPRKKKDKKVQKRKGFRGEWRSCRGGKRKKQYPTKSRSDDLIEAEVVNGAKIWGWHDGRKKLHEKMFRSQSKKRGGEAVVAKRGEQGGKRMQEGEEKECPDSKKK